MRKRSLCVWSQVSRRRKEKKMRREEEKGSGGGGGGGRWEAGRVGQEKHCAYWSVANTEIQDTDAG